MKYQATSIDEVLQKVIINNHDVQLLFDCSHTKASEIIKQIRQVQDSLGGMRGKLHIDDYHAYIRYNRRMSRGEKCRKEL